MSTVEMTPSDCNKIIDDLLKLLDEKKDIESRVKRLEEAVGIGYCDVCNDWSVRKESGNCVNCNCNSWREHE